MLIMAAPEPRVYCKRRAQCKAVKQIVHKMPEKHAAAWTLILITRTGAWCVEDLREIRDSMLTENNPGEDVREMIARNKIRDVLNEAISRLDAEAPGSAARVAR